MVVTNRRPSQQWRRWRESNSILNGRGHRGSRGSHCGHYHSRVRVTMEGPINPTLGVVVSGGRWTLSSTKTCLLRSQLPSPLTVSSDFWFPSTTFLPHPPPPQKAAVLVFKVPIGTARSTNRKNSLWHSNPTGYILSYRKNKREPTKRKSQGKTNHPVPQLGCTWKSLSQWAWLTSIESPAGANHHYSLNNPFSQDMARTWWIKRRPRKGGQTTRGWSDGWLRGWTKLADMN